MSKQAQLLKVAPFVFPFIERVKVSLTEDCTFAVCQASLPCQFFQQLVSHDRRAVQGQLQDFLMGPGLHLTARRNYIYEDAFAKLAHGEGQSAFSIPTVVFMEAGIPQTCVRSFGSTW